MMKGVGGFGTTAVEAIMGKRKKTDHGGKEPMIRAAQKIAGHDEDSTTVLSEEDAAQMAEMRARYHRPTADEIGEIARRLARRS